jgi:hypothetical protein
VEVEDPDIAVSDQADLMGVSNRRGWFTMHIRLNKNVKER